MDGTDNRTSMPVRWLNGLFWSLLALCLGLLLTPLWIGIAPPLSDFTGHAAMADIWVNYDKVPHYREHFIKAGWWVPNVLPMHFCKLVYPWLSVITALRIWLTVSLLLTVVSLLELGRVFGRSRWLIFPALPFLWNSSLYLGFVNYVPILPLVFFGLALTRKSRDSERFGEVHWLLLCFGMIAYFIHGMGWCIVVMASGGMGILSLSFRQLVRVGLAWLPSAAVWLTWYATRKSHIDGQAGAIPGLDSAALATSSIEYPSAFVRMSLFFDHGLNIAVSSADTNVFMALLAVIAVILIALKRPDGHAPDSRVAATTADSAPNASFWATLERDMLEHPLLLLWLFWGACVYLLPVSINGVMLSTRFVPCFFLTMPFLVRGHRFSPISSAALASSIVICLVFGGLLINWSLRFNQRELKPMHAALELVPEGAQVDCVGMDWVSAVFTHWPLMHTCRGLAHTQRKAKGHGGFARDSFNAVMFSKRYHPPLIDLHRFKAGLGVQSLDYAIVRDGITPPKGLAEHVQSFTGTRHGSAVYSLYRVRREPEFQPGTGFVCEGYNHSAQALGALCPDPFDASRRSTPQAMP